MEKRDANKLKLELKEFTGTEKCYYTPLFPEYSYTEGVKYLAEQASAYWLLDFIFRFSDKIAAKGEDFLVWKLIVKEDKSALLKVEDGNDNLLKKFKIPFTDFPLDQIDLWQIRQVLILPSEY